MTDEAISADNDVASEGELFDTPATHPELRPDHFQSGNPEMNLGLILNVPVSVAIEIGKTNISIGKLLKLCPGSVVELDRLVGEPHDVLVNGTLVAHGEIVVVKDRFGIRFTDIVSPAERVKGLN
ncbi:MAG: flagellar motor switch protein FliN [Pseudomonadota bacterium]